MRKRMAMLLVGIPLWSVSASAQSGPPDTLSALLAEVRQLRIAMERAATTTPHIQLLGSRLSVQSDRLARANQDHQTVKQELDQISAAAAQLAAHIPDVESRAAQEQDQLGRRALAQEVAAVKERLADFTAQEQRLRVREAELAATAAAEQNQWADLNRRLDDVERSLSVRETR
jgi:predicted  nucleic acid-binding Zn-ribbon protein